MAADGTREVGRAGRADRAFGRGRHQADRGCFTMSYATHTVAASRRGAKALAGWAVQDDQGDVVLGGHGSGELGHDVGTDDFRRAGNNSRTEPVEAVVE
jgi:hypothetical protein